jgi:hypothetical protein
MGLASAQMLLSLLGKHYKQTSSITIKGKLMVRESSGALEGAIPLEQYRTQTTPRRLAIDTDET